MTSVPEFSPRMLMLFLRARAVHAHAVQPEQRGFQATVKREKAQLRRLARITHAQVDMAWMGQVHSAATRAKLWAVLGHYPADHGILLTDDGRQVQS